MHWGDARARCCMFLWRHGALNVEINERRARAFTHIEDQELCRLFVPGRSGDRPLLCSIRRSWRPGLQFAEVFYSFEPPRYPLAHDPDKGQARMLADLAALSRIELGLVGQDIQDPETRQSF